jgi:hypothetical protein
VREVVEPGFPNRHWTVKLQKSVFSSALLPEEKLIATSVASISKLVTVLMFGGLFFGSIALWFYANFLGAGSLDLVCAGEGRRCTQAYFHAFWLVPASAAFAVLSIIGVILVVLGRRQIIGLSDRRILVATVGPRINQVHRIDTYELRGMRVVRGIFGAKITSGPSQLLLFVTDEFFRCLERQIEGRPE